MTMVCLTQALQGMVRQHMAQRRASLRAHGLAPIFRVARLLRTAEGARRFSRLEYGHNTMRSSKDMFGTPHGGLGRCPLKAETACNILAATASVAALCSASLYTAAATSLSRSKSCVPVK
jgi:hypothetical protein